ncbi:MAG: hypothetical protein IPH53_18555 [Flavobacteriales bacterium]|nr:hypothetical protein [Flavobacteriales bacterium]
MKFTEHGSVAVRASVADLQADQCTLVLKVIDTGIGIPEDRQDKIFEEFTQAYSDTTRKYGGTGLGLTISKRLAEAWGGSIDVKSERDKGSTFTVTIPYAIATDAHTTPAQGRSGSAERELRDLRILLAEDNDFNVLVAQDELAHAIPGVQVDVAANGRIAGGDGPSERLRRDPHGRADAGDERLRCNQGDPGSRWRQVARAHHCHDRQRDEGRTGRMPACRHERACSQTLQA